MARPDIKIDERVFQPKEMGVLRSVMAHILYGICVLQADAKYPYYPQYQRVVDTFRLAVFYGNEAANAFITFITPPAPRVTQVRSTTELQRLRQMEWVGAGAGCQILPEPVRDPFTGEYKYRFVEISPNHN